MNTEPMTNPVEQTAVDTAQECPKRKSVWKNPRGIALFVAFVLLFSAIGGYTLAYLQKAKENAAKNDFRLANVDIVRADTDAVKFINNSEVSVYIRVAVIGNWVKSKTVNGKQVISEIYGGSKPVRGTNYYLCYNNINDTTTAYNGFNADQWFKVEENGVTYYYHKAPIAPKTATNQNSSKNVSKVLCDLYVANSVNPPADGYTCAVEFAVQAIQAVGKTQDGKDPVTEAWGINVVNGNLQAPS